MSLKETPRRKEISCAGTDMGFTSSLSRSEMTPCRKPVSASSSFWVKPFAFLIFLRFDDSFSYIGIFILICDYICSNIPRNIFF